MNYDKVSIAAQRLLRSAFASNEPFAQNADDLQIIKKYTKPPTGFDPELRDNMTLEKRLEQNISNSLSICITELIKKSPGMRHLLINEAIGNLTVLHSFSKAALPSDPISKRQALMASNLIPEALKIALAKPIIEQAIREKSSASERLKLYANVLADEATAPLAKRLAAGCKDEYAELNRRLVNSQLAWMNLDIINDNDPAVLMATLLGKFASVITEKITSVSQPVSYPERFSKGIFVPGKISLN